ncbi:exonuclease domain-containing protein [Shivajiella indica]|uniref:Exonuclease domain-containing protein n=1 Tax=Shivajiella indica TaxID=872115 RepID=A0ABW5B5K4_9BACT
MEFVIVDIETTGGNPGQGGITEIAALAFDGGNIIDRFHTLINPERYIPNFITGLTGIDQNMVAEAPTFGEIAQELYDFLENRVFVAHNVNFDYSFIKEAFKTRGLEFNQPKLCTVRLSRKVFPGFKSYGLGRICEQLSIKIENRHRAFGDAEATTVLFDKIYRTKPEVIFETLKKNNGETFLPPNISKEKYLQIPEKTGIYYFHDQKGQVIYVGKAINIRSRFKSHFSGNSQEKLKLKSEIHDISWELTGSEFLAYLLEALEIKRIWPKFNRALKYKSSNWGLFQYEDNNGYIRFQVSKSTGLLKPVYEFDNHSEAWKFITEQTQSFQLCPKLTGIQKTPSHCYDHMVNKCLGACCGKESVTDYNLRVNDFLESINNQSGAILIKEKGISPEESCALYFENGVFKAYGFFDTSYFFSHEGEVLEALTKVKHLPETKYILRSFIPKISPRNIIPI